MRAAPALLIITAAFSLPACQKKPTGPTTGDGLPVDVNASNISVVGNQI